MAMRVSLFRHLKRLDWVIILASALLVGMGLLSLYSSSLRGGDFSNFQKQIIFFIIGVVVMGGISFFDWRLLRNDPYFILFLYFLGVAAVGGVFLFAPEIRGVKTWYRIGGISIDPIEYIKIVLIILMAKYFSMRHIEMYRIRHILLSGFYFAIPILLIFLQPNLGSAAVLLILWVITLLISGIKIRHFLTLLFVGALVFVFSWNFVLRDYQKNRVLAFIEPELDPLGIGWSQLQAKIAIGNGGILGKGIGKGTQTQYGFLSEPQTDFIFSALGEEFGLVGITVVVFLFLMLVWRIVQIGMAAQSNFPRLFATGVAVLIAVEMGINIGMNVGLLPIVGLPLPFVSYGGSSLIMSYIGLGILQSIKSH